MPIEVTRYKCEHCQKKVMANKSKIIKHENICFYNPEIKSCITCRHKDIDDLENGPWCSLLEKEIFVAGQPIRNCVYWLQEIDE